MTKRPVTVTQDASVDEALRLMRDEKVRRLPVLDKHGRLVGITSELNLLKVSPSPATSLSIWEIPYLLSRLKMQDVMTKDVITVTEDAPLEEAARVMADNKIGALPMLRDDPSTSSGQALVGIITETDMFKIFLEMFGARESGVRLSLLIPEEKGVLAKITGKIAEMGGNILALGTMMGESPTNREITIRVADVPEEELVSAMEEMEVEIKVLDARFCTLA